MSSTLAVKGFMLIMSVRMWLCVGACAGVEWLAALRLASSLHLCLDGYWHVWYVLLIAALFFWDLIGDPGRNAILVGILRGIGDLPGSPVS